MSHRWLAPDVPSIGLVFALAASACAPSGSVMTTSEAAAETQALEPGPRFDGDPANKAVFGVDISHWEGPVSESEMDCFWEAGVRHVVSGTQVEEITRQQLGVAVSRGMAVDAYVYLYWDRDMATQVREAFRRVAGFPIGRMWLDLEEDPRGIDADALVDLSREGLAACKATSAVPCGIYTGPGFWKTYMNNTTAFAKLPLWYAWYNGKPTLSVWSEERFGGWAAPAGKQWAEEPLCGVGVDKNVMQPAAPPAVVVDRTLPPDDGAVPPAPARPYPADGARVTIGFAKLMVSPVPRAVQYQLALEVWRRDKYEPYFIWTLPEAFIKAEPLFDERPFRFRARARNAHGWGVWSSWSHFYLGLDATAPIPGAADQPPPTTPAPAQPAPDPSLTSPSPEQPDDAPLALSPDGETFTGSSVTLRCAAFPGASGYEIVAENESRGAFVPYAKWSTVEPTKTFFPQVRGTTYRWRVRARTNGVLGSYSAWASFLVK